jgi:hypothetical protein
MKKYRPETTNSHTHLATYDFEWVTDPVTDIIKQQLPYAYGVYTELEGEEVYEDHLVMNDIYNAFITSIIGLAIKVRATSDKKRVCLQLTAHNGMKADYPLILKAMLNDKRLTFLRTLGSAMSSVSHIWQVGCESDGLTIQFTDTINFWKLTLGEIGKQFNLPVEKQECDHTVINKDNYQSEIVR